MMNELVLKDKIIVKILLTKDKQAIKFILKDSDDVIAKCDADGYSYTWIEHLSLPAGFYCKVLDVCDLDMPDLGDMPDCEVVLYYGFKITTDKGDIIIDYRNDSNGYYGGSLSWPGDYFYGGVSGQNISEEEWIEVKTDI